VAGSSGLGDEGGMMQGKVVVVVVVMGAMHSGKVGCLRFFVCCV